MCTTSGISPSFLGLSRSSGQVTHVLLTRSRLCPRASPGSSHHLHVLSTPPAFVLSQDQTLRERYFLQRAVMPGKLQIAGYTYSATGMTGKSDHPARWRTEWIGLKHPTNTNVRGGHAAQFSKTAAPFAAGLAAPYARARPGALPRRTKEYSAAAAVCLAGRLEAAE